MGHTCQTIRCPVLSLVIHHGLQSEGYIKPDWFGVGSQDPPLAMGEAFKFPLASFLPPYVCSTASLEVVVLWLSLKGISTVGISTPFEALAGPEGKDSHEFPLTLGTSLAEVRSGV